MLSELNLSHVQQLVKRMEILHRLSSRLNKSLDFKSQLFRLQVEILSIQSGCLLISAYRTHFLVFTRLTSELVSLKQGLLGVALHFINN